MSEADSSRVVIDFNKLNTKLTEWRLSYQSGIPFPFIVLDNFLVPEVAKQAFDTFPKPESGEWIQYKHVNEKKLGKRDRATIPDIHLSIIDELNSRRFVEWLSALTGIPNLVADHSLEGGGLHQIEPGGFLNIHADFTAHQHHEKWARRVNMLVYFNHQWEESFGGHLELWNRDMSGCGQKILPIFNRCVIFNTDKDSFHGHPHPLTSPAGMTRKSIALYYFTEEHDIPFTRSTEYRPMPTDHAGKRLAIFFDKMALRIYDSLKRRLGFDDKLISKILKFISKS